MNRNRRDFLKAAAFLGVSAASGRSIAVAADAVKSVAAKGTVRIAHCGDPQFGFGPHGKNAYKTDLARFERMIDVLNDLRPDLVFLSGDQTHNPTDLTRDWPRLLKRFKVPLLATPGNHDLGYNILGSHLARYRSVFGYDYKSMKVGQWRFICGNTLYWRKTEERAEKERYEAWLKSELASAKAAGEPVILGGHIPPFFAGENEKTSLSNCPKSIRAARLKMYVDGGARFFLSGHTHCLLVRAYKGMTILTSETTSRNFDGLPFGFRMLTLHPNGEYGWNFHKVV